MVASCAAIAGDGKWNVCLLGYKTTVVFWFATIDFLKITSLSSIWLALLFLSETIFEMCSSFPKGVSLSSKRLESYIEMLSKAFEKSEEVIRFVDNMSNGNLRKALDFIVTFVGSAHVDSEKIFRVIEASGNYTLPLHEFLRAVIFQDNEYYNSADSQIQNLYDVSSNDKHEHFLVSILISYVERMGLTGGNEGFVLISDVLGYLQGLGFTEHQIHSALQRTTTKDLLATPKIEAPTLTSGLRIQSAGAYTIKRLATLFTYTDAIITDTPIMISEYRTRIQAAYTIDERLERATSFLDYLDNCWDPKMAGVYDWMSISQLVRKDIVSIRNRINSRSNK